MSHGANIQAAKVAEGRKAIAATRTHHLGGNLSLPKSSLFLVLLLGGCDASGDVRILPLTVHLAAGQLLLAEGFPYPHNDSRACAILLVSRRRAGGGRELRRRRARAGGPGGGGPHADLTRAAYDNGFREGVKEGEKDGRRGDAFAYRDGIPFTKVTTRIAEDSGRWAMIVDYAPHPDNDGQSAFTALATACAELDTAS